jgi:hypothetical protein
MIDTNDPAVQAIVGQGYRLAVHAYLQADGRTKITVVGKHKTGKVVQGWAGTGGVADALRDLMQRARIVAPC